MASYTTWQIRSVGLPRFRTFLHNKIPCQLHKAPESFPHDSKKELLSERNACKRKYEIVLWEKAHCVHFDSQGVEDELVD